MRVLLFLGAVALLAAGCGDLSGQNGAAPYPPTVSVTGVGTATGVADMAVISFNIEVSNADAAVAVDEASELAESAIAAAVEMGIAEEDIETTGYNLYMEEEYNYNTYEYTGENLFYLTHSFSVKVRDITRAGEVLATLVRGGATSIGGINFTVSNRDELIAEARGLAIAQAKETAGQLAEGLGVSLGDPVSISEWIDYYGGYDGYGGGAYAEDYYYDSPPISPGNSSVTLNVSISYEIK